MGQQKIITELNYPSHYCLLLVMIPILQISVGYLILTGLYGQPDNTPPGGELVFERWTRVSDNTDWIQISFVYQTIQQMREFKPFSSSSLPNKIVLTLPSCQDKNPEGMCPLKHFIDIVQTARIPQCAVMADVTR